MSAYGGALPGLRLDVDVLAGNRVNGVTPDVLARKLVSPTVAAELSVGVTKDGQRVFGVSFGLLKGEGRDS